MHWGLRAQHLEPDRLGLLPSQHGSFSHVTVPKFFHHRNAVRNNAFNIFVKSACLVVKNRSTEPPCLALHKC